MTLVRVRATEHQFSRYAPARGCHAPTTLSLAATNWLQLRG